MSERRASLGLYPYRCRNGHTVTGPADVIETARKRRGGGKPYPVNYCRACRSAAQARYDDKLTRSGAGAERQARLARRIADARDAELELELRDAGVITRPGDGTKTKSGHTSDMDTNPNQVTA